MSRSRTPKKPVLQKLHEAQRTIGLAMKEQPRVVLRCGRRFGKTTLLERLAAKTAMSGGKVGWFGPRYKLNFPTYKRILRVTGPVVSSRSKIDQVIEMRGGGAVEFWTLEDEDAGRSRDYDLVIVDEASLKKRGLREIWEQSIAPTLLDRSGRAVMGGTPKGIDEENYFYSACTDKNLGWIEYHAPTALNPTLDPAAVAKLIDEYPRLVYQQEYLAEFVDWNGVAFFPLEHMLADGLPVPYPERTGQIYAVIDTALKDGQEHDGTAVVYFAREKYFQPRLIVLDWDIIQVEGALLESWLPSVYSRMNQLSDLCHAREGVLGSFIEDKASGIVLLQQAKKKQLRAFALPAEITALGKEGRALSVSGYFHRGEIKLSQFAFDKVVRFKGVQKNHFISQLCGFRMGDTDNKRADDLADCGMYGAAIGCGNARGF